MLAVFIVFLHCLPAMTSLAPRQVRLEPRRSFLFKNVHGNAIRAKRHALFARLHPSTWLPILLVVGMTGCSGSSPLPLATHEVHDGHGEIVAQHQQPSVTRTEHNAASARTTGLRLTVLHINDHHSRLDDEPMPLQLKTASGRREGILVQAGGFPRVSAAIKELAATHDNVITIHAGDATTGDLYYSLTEGRADADLMNTVCFDTFTIGNHEFDSGDAGLRRFLEHLRASDQCNTAVLSANTLFGVDSPLNPANAPGYVSPSVVLERDGRKIGLIGITIAGKTQTSSRPDPGTRLLPELATAQAQIDFLRASGVSHIILQTHQGYQADLAFGRQLTGVDAIIGGDSHSLLGPTALARYGATVEGPYPTTVTNRDGKLVCVAQAWQYAKVVGRLDIQFDADGDVVACGGTPYVLIGDRFQRQDRQAGQLTPQDILAIKRDISDSGVLRMTQPDAQALRVLAPYRAQKLAFGATIIASAHDRLCARRVPGLRFDPVRSSQGDECNRNPRTIRHGGDSQQLVAEAFLQQGKAWFDADIALINGGGVRTDMAVGPVSVKDVHAILPFKNTLVRLTLTGAQLKAVLEDAVDGLFSSRPSTGAYPYAAGLRWTLDITQAKGKRFSDLQVRDANGRYTPLDLSARYQVATIDYLADGHDHYAALRTIKGADRLDVGRESTEAFLDYVHTLPGQPPVLHRVPDAHYSTQHFIE